MSSKLHGFTEVPSWAIPQLKLADNASPADFRAWRKTCAGFIALCKYCLSEGHQLSECRKRDKAGKSSLTSEQKDAFKAKIKALKGHGDTTPKSKDHPAKGSAKTKTTNTAIKVISDDGTDKGQGNNKSEDERADILSKAGGGANFGARRDELVKKDPDLQDA